MIIEDIAVLLCILLLFVIAHLKEIERQRKEGR